MAREKRGKRLGWRVIVWLLICAGITTEWVRSRSHTDMLAYLTPAAKLQGLAADRDGAIFFVSGMPMPPEQGFSLRWLTVPGDDFDSIRTMLFDPTAVTVHQRLGFKAATGNLNLASALTPKFGALSLPYWFLLALALLPTAASVRRWVRRHLRRRRGQCLECGYDLRASGNRCPECGTERGSAVPAANV